MMTVFEQKECIQEVLQDLQEDAALLRLAVLGMARSTDKLTLSCLLRLSDYLNQHVNDIRVLCGR